MLDGDSRIQLAPELMFRQLDEESVLLHLRSGQYFGVNEAGTRVLVLLQKAMSLRSLHEKLLEEYDIDPGQLWEDVCGFLDDMKKRGLIEIDASRPE